MAPFSLTNRFIAPTFENGVNGWTVTGAGAAGTTLSTSTAYSLHGTQCLKVSIAAGAGAVRLVPPSFPMILNPYRVFGLSLSVASTTATAQVIYGFERFKPDLTFYNESLTASPTVTSTMTKFGRLDHLSNNSAAFVGGLLPKITIPYRDIAQEYYFDGFTWVDQADQEMYPFILNGATIPPIAGSWASDADYSYSWTGAVEASTSVATHVAELIVPAEVNRGDTIAITGTGFPPSSTVDIIIGEHWNRDPVATLPTDSSGNLSGNVPVPYASETGMGYIVGKPASGALGSMLLQEIWTKPYDLSTVTNYFPNPNGQTLAVDGVTPKYFGPSYYDGDVTTRVNVGGEYRARIDPEYAAIVMDLGPALLSSLGLDDAKHYLIRGRVHSDFISDDRWAYIHTSSGDSDVPMVGTSPWNLIGIGTGPFDGPGEWISYSWPDDATIDIDHVSIMDGAVYLFGWSTPIAPGETMDGYKMGLRPGRQYQLSGTSVDGIFKIRTGTSPGSLTDLVVWENVDPDTWVGAAPQSVITIPAGHTTIQLEASGTGTSRVSIFDYVPYFDGDTPDGDGYTYSWAGTPHDSASIRTAGGTTLDAKVFIEGTAVAVTEMRVVVDGTLIDVTEAGG